MKKITFAALALSLLIPLAACGSDQAASDPRGGINDTAKTVDDALNELTVPSDTPSPDLPEVTPEVTPEISTSEPVEEPTPAPSAAEPSAPAVPTPAPASTVTSVDVDLTALSSTMVYTEVYNMMMRPSDYVGKVIKMSGLFYPYTNQDGTKYYPACLIQDATACCAQGIEFLLTGAEYPDGYPEIGSTVTVTGTFETYEEDGILYCHLVDAWL